MNRSLLALLWLLAILVATLTPGEQLPETPDVVGFDKLVHFSLFFTLVFLWHRTGRKSLTEKLNKKKFITNYLVFGIGIAILVEYLQRYIPGRSFDLLDMVANLLGGAVGTVCFYILYGKKSNLV